MPMRAKDNPTTIPFRIHPRVFAALGADLVTNDIVAVIELVKNSYDACASRVDVRFIQGEDARVTCIEVEDDGEGMSRVTIEEVWCLVATPFRTIQPVNRKGRKERRVSGEKGLGRLSTARLGNRLEMLTKAADNPCYQVSVDWKGLSAAEELKGCFAECREYEQTVPFSRTGTRLHITNLNSDWTDEMIAELRNHLSRLLSPFSKVSDFKIWLTLPGNEVQPTEIEAPDFLSKPPYFIKGNVDGVGNCDYTYIYSWPGKPRRFNKKSCLWHPNDETLPGKANKAPACGPFEFEIRAWDIAREDLQDISNRFNLRRNIVRKAIRERAGISLYRDGILVLPKSEKTRDWLGLDLRRVSRVGKRLRTSQLVGYVGITAEANQALRDTSDREMLVDNQASEDFHELLCEIVRVVEEQRERDRLSVAHKEPPLKDLFGELSAEALVEGVKRIALQDGPARRVVPLVEEYNQKLKESVERIEDRVYYYSRLATIGVLAAMLVHEVRNRTNVIGGLTRAVRRLVECQNPSVKQLEPDLDLAERSVQTLEHLADTFAPLASRGCRTRRNKCFVEDIIAESVAYRQQDIERMHVQVRWPKSTNTEVAVDPSDLSPVLLNVIDNSIYWLATAKQANPRIEFEILRMGELPRVKIEAHDTGPGIESGEDEKVFWPGVTRKPGGLGMGLTVAAEIVSQYGGRMYVIQPGKLGGASFGFDIPLSEGKK